MPLKTGEVQTRIVSRRETVGSHVVDTPQRERRYIYNGETPRSTNGYVLRQNRRGVRRKVSTFNLIVVLLAIGLAIVVYVNNIIIINRLSAEVGRLQKRYDEIQNVNATLRAEVNKKAAWERIGTVAGEQLGLRYPTEQPVWIDVDQNKLEELKKQ